MAGYTRQSTYADGDIIQASDSNNEFDQLEVAFNSANGHRHNGTPNEGPVLSLIGDPGLATPINKVVVDDTNNRVGVFIDVAGLSVEQVRLQDGSIVPVTTNDIDLGTTTAKFKDAYFAGNVSVDGNITLGGTITLGDADTDNITLNADVNSHVIPNVDDTYDLGSATKEWRNLYIDGTAKVDILVVDENATVAGTLSVTGNQTNTGGLTVNGNAVLNGNTTIGNAATDTVTVTADVASNLVPSADATYDLGAVGSEWNNLYVTGTANVDALVIGTSTGITSVDTDLTTVSTLDDTLASAKAIKTYVDALVTAQDLDFQADTGGALNIDLDSEVLTVAGGTGIDTVGSGNTITVSIDGTVPTLTGVQTLTNKTITSPAVNTPTIVGGTLNGTIIGGTTPAAVTGTTVTATTGFVGNVTGTVSSLSNHTTTNLTEGANLYYTTARANAAIDARVTQTYVNNLNVDAATLNGKTSTDIEDTALFLSIALG